MIKIILYGCNGKMGQTIARAVKSRDDCEIAFGIDVFNSKLNDFEVFSPSEFLNSSLKGDVIIDFSNTSSLENILKYSLINNVPCVLCTTGYFENQLQEIDDASKSVAIFKSGNMSLGINLIIELSKKAASVLGNDFNIEIIEKHHNQKLDAPSGTASMIADAVSSVLDHEPQYVYDRHNYRKKRNPSEIGIHSVRGGTIVGEHEIMFAGPDEILSISHSAQSKEVFATGALNAALFLANKPPKMYNMSDLLKDYI